VADRQGGKEAGDARAGRGGEQHANARGAEGAKEDEWMGSECVLLQCNRGILPNGEPYWEEQWIRHVPLHCR